MKTHILTLIALNFFLSANAQQFPDEKKIDKKWQVGINLNSLEPITDEGYDVYLGQARLFNDFDHQKNSMMSFGISASRKFYENFHVRLHVNIGQYKVEEYYTGKDYVSPGPPSSTYNIDTGSVKQSIYTIAPGALWNFPYKKINLYCGFQLVFKKLQTAKEHLIYWLYDTPTDTLQSYRYYDINLDGGYEIGVAPLIGFSINIFKGISIGGEFSAAYSYYHTGGTLNWTETRFYPMSYQSSFTNKSSYHTTKFSRPVISLCLSYSF